MRQEISNGGGGAGMWKTNANLTVTGKTPISLDNITEPYTEILVVIKYSNAMTSSIFIKDLLPTSDSILDTYIGSYVRSDRYFGARIHANNTSIELYNVYRNDTTDVAASSTIIIYYK